MSNYRLPNLGDNYLTINKKSTKSLKACLSAMVKDKLEMISDSYTDKTYKTKAELVDFLAEAICQKAEYYFYFVPDLEFEVFINIVYDKSRQQKAEHFDVTEDDLEGILRGGIIRGFMRLGLVFQFRTTDEKGNTFEELVVPDEIEEIIVSKIDKFGKHEYCKYQHFIDVAEILVSLYGIVSPTIFTKIWNAHFKDNQLKETDTHLLMKQSEEISENYFYGDGSIFALDLIDEELRIDLLKDRQMFQPWIPDDKEFSVKYNAIFNASEWEKFFIDGTYEYEGDNPAFISFCKYIKEITKDKETADLIIASFMYFIKAAYPVSQTLDFVNKEFDFTENLDEKQLSKFMELFTALRNSCHMWANYGHTPIELRKLSESKVEEQPFDSFAGNMLFIPKVGRNEPCPCGSGKKYKNCHGK